MHGPLREIRAFAGDGLFTAFEKEPNWGKAHRILMPAFGPMAMRTYFDDMLDIADRAMRHGRGEPSGDTHVFFGCDHLDVDFLYRPELEAYEKRGRLKLHTAFYRQPEGDITFVQHRLWAERALVKDLLDRGASVFVCGDGQRMYPAVRETLEKIHADATSGTEADGRAWLTAMERDGRFVADVFA